MPLTLTNINIGAAPNDGTGDPARTAFGYINANNDLTEAGFAVLEGDIAALEALSAKVGILVADATGNHVTDTAAINAAFAAAGSGGVVIFPSDQTYRTYRKPGTLTTLPRLVKGNGCTLKLRDEVSTTLTGGPYSAGATSITVASSTGISAGDFLMISNASAYIYPAYVSNVVGNTLTVTALAFASGASVTGGDPVSTSDRCLSIEAGEDGYVEVTGLTFDGNQANRPSNRRWTAFSLVDVAGGAPTYSPKMWFHHNVFQNSACDALGAANIPYTVVSDNHFENIYGNGYHPGSSVAGSTVDHICTNNTFSDVFKYTGSTSPTLLQYGHVSGHGAIVTSQGPARYVVANNVVDVSKGYGFDGVDNSATTHITVTSNVFKDCKHGAFRAESATGSKAVFSGNVIQSCGQSGSVDTGSASEVTKIHSCTAADMVISDNVFDNSVFGIFGSSGQIVVANNTFNLITKVSASGETGALMLVGGSCKDIVVTGNYFRGPRTAAESTAVSDTPLTAIEAFGTVNLSVTNNIISGFRHGLANNGNSLTGLLISGNVFTDQVNNGGTNAHGVLLSAATSLNGVSIVNNVITRQNETMGAWLGIEVGLITNMNGLLISGNLITSHVTGTHTGITMGSNTGSGVSISNNTVKLFDAGDQSILVSSFTSSGLVLNNDFQGTFAPALEGARTVTSLRQSITAAGAIKTSTSLAAITESVGGYAITLAAPVESQAGQDMVITMIGRNAGTVTLALTEIIGGTGGTTTASFDAVGETLTLTAAGTKWMVTGQSGVTIT